MTPDKVYDELNDFLTLSLRSNLALSATPTVLEVEHFGFARVTWATNSDAPGYLFRTATASVAEYREWIDCQGYTVVLFDGSFIQISYDFTYTQLIGHRLMYFPCPFDIDPGMLLSDLSLIEVIDLYHDERDRIRLRSPIRFDYDVNASSAYHPTSHFRFQWAHTRIPVMAPISLGHFIRFIFKNFYPEIWNTLQFVREWPLEYLGDTITDEEKETLHINSTMPATLSNTISAC